MNTSERLTIVPLEPAHAELMFDALRDPRIYSYIPEEPPETREQLELRYARWSAGSREDGETWRNWTMFLTDAHEPVGTLQATLYPEHRAVIAYTVLPRFWRQGFAIEGVSWMLQQIANEQRVTSVEAFIDTRNQASIRLVERLQFRCLRTLQDADHFKGGASDEFVFAKCLRLSPRV
jgi:ribosomal-protein-alanine N-acetyltransferase